MSGLGCCIQDPRCVLRIFYCSSQASLQLWCSAEHSTLFLQTVVEPVSPALEGEFLTTGSPGKSLAVSLKLVLWLSFDNIQVPNHSLFRSPKEFWKSLPWASDIVTERLKVQNHLSVSVLPIPILEFCVCVLSKHFYFYALPLNFYVYFSASLLQFEYLG